MVSLHMRNNIFSVVPFTTSTIALNHFLSIVDKAAVAVNLDCYCFRTCRQPEDAGLGGLYIILMPKGVRGVQVINSTSTIRSMHMHFLSLFLNCHIVHLCM